MVYENLFIKRFYYTYFRTSAVHLSIQQTSFCSSYVYENQIFVPLVMRTAELFTACHRLMPLPLEDFRQVLAHLVDVLLMLDELVVHLLDQVGAAVAQLRQVLDGVLD